MPESHSEVLIIGAGWYGLAVAKQCLEVRPDVDLTILDAGKTIGGVWSKERIHKNLVADSPSAFFHFSDLAPHEIDELGVTRWSDIPSGSVHRYLELYVEQHDIRRHIRLNTKVVSVSRHSTGWKLDIVDGNGKGSWTCDKLIVACGSFQEPRFPDLDTSAFSGVTMHSKDIGSRLDDLLPKISRVTVVGGNKSAVDAVNAAAQAGKEVDWVIRREGVGPTFLAGRKNGLSAFQIKSGRWMMNWTPIMSRPQGWRSWFLFTTALGRWVLKRFWTMVTNDVYGDNYEKSENGRLIEPSVRSLLWQNCAGASLHEKGGFMDLLNEDRLIHVHRESIVSMKERTLTLSSGVELPSDLVIFATGWQPNHKTIFSESLRKELGLPVHLEDEDVSGLQHWAKLDKEAEALVRQTFPVLQDAPICFMHPAETTPFRLYRGMVPPALAAKGDRSIAFVGTLNNSFNTTWAEVGGLWTVGYLENLLPEHTQAVLQDQKAMEKEIATMQAYLLLRFQRADHHPTIFLEAQSFIDTFVQDLGCEVERKRDGTVMGYVYECFAPYVCADYKGLTQEFLSNASRRSKND